VDGLKIVADYQRLVDRMASLLTEYSMVGESPHLVLQDDVKARIEWHEDGDYDSGCYMQGFDFPAVLLSFPDEEIKYWVQQELVARKREQEESGRRYMAEREARERQEFARLKAKFGG